MEILDVARDPGTLLCLKKTGALSLVFFFTMCMMALNIRLGKWKWPIEKSA
jgi:hypothetical protein